MPAADALIAVTVSLGRLCWRLGGLLLRVALLRPPLQALAAGWATLGLCAVLAVATGTLRWGVLDDQPLTTSLAVGCAALVGGALCAWGHARQGWPALAGCWYLCMAATNLIAMAVQAVAGSSQGELWLPMLGIELVYCIVAAWHFDHLPPRVRRFSDAKP